MGERDGKESSKCRNEHSEGGREGKVTEGVEEGEKEEEQFFILASANASAVIRRCLSLARSLSAASSLPLTAAVQPLRWKDNVM